MLFFSIQCIKRTHNIYFLAGRVNSSTAASDPKNQEEKTEPETKKGGKVQTSQQQQFKTELQQTIKGTVYCKIHVILL